MPDADHAAAAAAIFGGGTDQVSDQVTDNGDNKGADDKQQNSVIADALGGTKDTNQVDKDTDQATKSDDEFIAPDEGSQARANWDKLRTAYDQSKTTIAELEAKLNDSPSNEATESMRARVSELEEQNNILSERLRAVDFQNHPEFFEKFEKPIQDSTESIRNLLKMEEVGDENLEGILRLNGREFTNAMSDLAEQMSDFSKAELYRLGREIKDKMAAREQSASNQEDFLKQANETAMARVRETFDSTQKEYTQLFGRVETPEGADEETVKSDQEFNAAIDAIPVIAEKLAFAGLSDEDTARVAHEAALFQFVTKYAMPRLDKHMSTQISAKDQEIASLKEQIENLTGANPGYKPSQQGDGPVAIEDMSHKDAAKLINFG